MIEAPVYSVIVPAYNAEATLAGCLAALGQQTIVRHQYEVVVVDDGSTDGTSSIASEEADVVVRQENQGPAAARNIGVAASRGGIVLFTDADCEPAPDWIEQMVAPLAQSQVAGSKGVYRTRQSNLTARFIQVEYQDRYDFTARQGYVDFIDTYAAAYRRSALDAVGGFDTRFPLASVEDQELSFRVARAGYRMRFAPRAIVFHRHPESWSHYARRKFKIGYWKALVLRFHPDKAWQDTHTPPDLKVQLSLAAVTVPLLALAMVRLVPAWAGGAGLATFALSALRFTAKAWQRDRAVAFIALPALYLRAWSLGLGLVSGYLSTVLHRGALWDALNSAG